MESVKYKRWRAFVSLAWYDGLISFIFRFLAKTSEPVLAFGVIISASDFLQKGQLMAHNPTLVTAWAWTQAFAIEASTGPVLASSLQAFRTRDTIKGVLYACLAGLLFVVGGAMLLLQLISNITGHSEATINPYVLYTLLTLRVLVASGIVALLCTKHMRFSGDDLRLFNQDCTEMGDPVQGRIDIMIWEGVLKEKLEELGITVRVATFTGDSSYPVEYTLIAGNVQAGGEPTLDLAMIALIEKLLKVTATDEGTSYKAMEAALQLLTGNILALRTELLVIKEEVTREEDHGY